MQGFLAVITIVLLVATVLTRSLLLKRKKIQAFNFGKIDKKDFLIPPFALFYFYLVFAACFDEPWVNRQKLFYSDMFAWVGVVFCGLGLTLMLISLISFGRSFRVGIDTEHPDKLITTGIFSMSRNPIYVAFFLVLLGQFLVFTNWILLVYLVAGTWLFNRQVLREEEYLRGHYGQEYQEYCAKVRRYF